MAPQSRYTEEYVGVTAAVTHIQHYCTLFEGEMASNNIREVIQKQIINDYLYIPSIVHAASENLTSKAGGNEADDAWDESASSLSNSVTQAPQNYIDLRRIQNEQFVKNTLEQGISSAKSDDVKKAEACYKSVLSVEPNHVDCLVRPMPSLISIRLKFV